MKFSEFKKLRSFCIGNGMDAAGFRESAEFIIDDQTDFRVESNGNEYRFIRDDVIDDTMADELKSEGYILGCFNSWVIADATGWPIELIEAAQKCEAYQEIGDAMTDDHIIRLVEIYAGADGYGHHFSHYDGSENNIFNYFVFRTN